jgi:hypothetical protein
VAFVSGASNLVDRDANRFVDVFVRDRVAKTTTLLNIGLELMPGAKSTMPTSGPSRPTASTAAASCAHAPSKGVLAWAP